MIKRQKNSAMILKPSYILESSGKFLEIWYLVSTAEQLRPRKAGKAWVSVIFTALPGDSKVRSWLIESQWLNGFKISQVVQYGLCTE